MRGKLKPLLAETALPTPAEGFGRTDKTAAQGETTDDRSTSVNASQLAVGAKTPFLAVQAVSVEGVARGRTVHTRAIETTDD
jgi:hypothetical protein